MVVRVDEEREDYRVRVGVAAPSTRCAHCGSDDIVNRGTRERLIRDLPAHGKRVGISVSVRRVRCRRCERTSAQALPAVATGRHMTLRLESWLRDQSLRRPLAALAEETGVGEKAIRSIFSETTAALEQQLRIETPRWLGIDEIRVGRPRCVLANVEENALVDILPGRERAPLAERLMRIADRERIELVTMGMRTPYRDAVTATLPRAQIVVDPFHVRRTADAALETVRTTVCRTLPSRERRGLTHDRFLLLKRRDELQPQERLLVSTWLRRSDPLREAYELKESFVEICEAPSADARRKFAAWRSRLTPATENAFLPVLAAWTDWEPMILAPFDHRVADAYTESLRNLIRAVERTGRDSTFEVLRAKLLYGSGRRRPVRLKFQRMKIAPYAMAMVASFPAGAPPALLGADIPALVRRLNSGEV